MAHICPSPQVLSRQNNPYYISLPWHPDHHHHHHYYYYYYYRIESLYAFYNFTAQTSQKVLKDCGPEHTI